MLASLLTNCSCAVKSTGRCLTVDEAGLAPKKLFSFQFRAGRIGRGAKPPPQLGHTLDKTFSTQVAQKVHSKLHIRAANELNGRAMLQFSQVGLSCSMVFDLWTIYSRISYNNFGSPEFAALCLCQAAPMSRRIFLWGLT